MTIRSKAAVAAVLVCCSVAAHAQQRKPDLFPRDTRSYQEREQQRTNDEMRRVYQEEQRRAEQERARQRDRERDFGHHEGRVRTGPNTSVGGGAGESGAQGNIRWTY